jgi:phosphomannomutase
VSYARREIMQNALFTKLDKEVDAANLSTAEVMIDCRGKDLEAGCGTYAADRISGILDNRKQKSIFLTGDGRYNTQNILLEMADAFTQRKIDVVWAGPNNTTPFFEVERQKLAMSGINVTASHQPWNYNGIKAVIMGANNLDPELQCPQSIAETMNRARIFQADDMLFDNYISYVVERKRPMKGNFSDVDLLYDAMDGTSFRFFEAVADELGIRYGVAREYPNPRFVNCANGPDPIQKANYDMLKKAGMTDHDLIVIVDGDGDRCGVATRNELIAPPYAVTLRAIGMKDGYRNNFYAENCLASVIKDFLYDEEIKVIGVKRGRRNHISAIQDDKSFAMGGAEWALHQYNDKGVDDALEATLDYIALANHIIKRGKTMDDYVSELRTHLRYFCDEIRVEPEEPAGELVQRLHGRFYPNASLKDGLIVNLDQSFLQVRASSNAANELAININGINQTIVEDIYRDLKMQMTALDQSLYLQMWGYGND